MIKKDVDTLRRPKHIADLDDSGFSYFAGATMVTSSSVSGQYRDSLPPSSADSAAGWKSMRKEVLPSVDPEALSQSPKIGKNRMLYWYNNAVIRSGKG